MDRSGFAAAAIAIAPPGAATSLRSSSAQLARAVAVEAIFSTHSKGTAATTAATGAAAGLSAAAAAAAAAGGGGGEGTGLMNASQFLAACATLEALRY